MEWRRRPPGGLLPGDPPRRDPRQGPRRPPGAGDARTRIAVGAGHGRRPSTWLKDLDPGRGGGLLLGPCVRRSGQQGGARGVLIVCCDGPAGLPEAARGGPGPTPWSPPAWSTPVRATRAVRRPQGTARGSPPPGARACTAPDEEAARRAPGAFRQSDPGPRAPPDGGDVGEGLGEVHPLPGLPPGPAPGHLCTTNAVRVAQPPSRAVRREPRPLSPPTRRRSNCCGRRVCNIEDRRAAQRAKDEEHARPLAQGQRVDSSTGRVTTNRSAPPAGPPGSPPPTPTESTPISDRTRLHRNIDRLNQAVRGW